MARTCRSSQTEAWSINWEPTNTAAAAFSVGKSTSGFGRSKPYGRSARPTFPVTETIFELRLRTVRRRLDHFLPLYPLSHQLQCRNLRLEPAVNDSDPRHRIVRRRTVHAAEFSNRSTNGTPAWFFGRRIAAIGREHPACRHAKWRRIIGVIGCTNGHTRFRRTGFVFRSLQGVIGKTPM